MACLNEGDSQHAPVYSIPGRRLGALEHPLILKDLDRGIKTFGRNPTLQTILDSASPQISVPLYLRPDNPTVRPLTSHNALSHNVVLKVVVPKRTGRKRKRGSGDPFEGDPVPESDVSVEVSSAGRADAPKVLRQKLRDNVGKYTVEPIGIIRNTHRYRGLADFQYSLGSSKFMTKFVDKVLPGDVGPTREFALEPGVEPGPGIDLIPPPNFTPMTLPFNYNYSQNPYTKEVIAGGSSPLGSEAEEDEYNRVVNVTSRIPAAGYFIAHDEYPVPSGPSRQPDMSDPQVALIMTEMLQAMEERPIWTRRSMWNRLASKFASLPKSGSLVRHCLQYAGYQFKGGPWRDALVKYGLDPRTDPKYRIYQTLIFKLHKNRVGTVGRSWQAVRRNEIAVTNFGRYWEELGTEENEAPLSTHIFNGEAFSTDGKVWQVCDITDPLLARLFEQAEVRTEVDLEISGFYHRVLWSVAKAVMKCKMLAIRFGRTLTDEDFTATLEAVKGPSDGGDGGCGTSIGISLPDLRLTQAECEQLRGRKGRPGARQARDRWEEKRRRSHHRVRIPLKETEAREAEKMIRLLSATMNKAPKPGGDSMPSGLLPLDAATNEEAAAPMPTADTRRVTFQEPEEPTDEVDEAEDQERGVYQELFDDLDEDDDDSDEDGIDDEEDEEHEDEEEEGEEGEVEDGEGEDEEEEGEEEEEDGLEEDPDDGDVDLDAEVEPNRGDQKPLEKRRHVTFADTEEPQEGESDEEMGDYDEDERGEGEEDYGEEDSAEDFDPADMAFGH
ncbi:transcription factor tau subunit sfc1 [Echria macrotheca]|uniref:Transcription factor tau subunit sfc1 n=1 Tax=Echria macrotheca TaxID=438768 RepID=A0AAJ0FB93_9PEZI|nr:transcription factor tau subunit sfc1 [Echria macrotheca]